MWMMKVGIVIAVELITIAAGYYFFYLAKKENSKDLKIGAYILVIGGILLALSTTAVTIKKMACKRSYGCHRCHDGDKRWGGGDKPQCLHKDKEIEEAKEE